MSHFSSSFFSALLEQLRLTLQEEHKVSSETLSELLNDIGKVQTTLREQRHQPELAGVYVMLTLSLVIGFIICFGMTLLRNSLVNFMIRHQLRHARAQGFQEISLLKNPGSSEA